jgi:uncharacterized protein YkwD
MTRRLSHCTGAFLIGLAVPGASRAGDAISPQVVQGHLMRLNTFSRAGHEEALKSLAGKPDHLQAVIAYLESQLQTAAEAYAKSSQANVRREQVRKIQVALAAHGEQKKIVGHRFVTRDRLPEFLKLVELHEHYFNTLKAFLTPTDGAEKRMAELEKTLDELRACGGNPANRSPDAGRLDFLSPELRAFVQQEIEKYRRIRQVYLYNRDHTPFAKDYHRKAVLVNNDYRLIHGVMPVELDEKLLRCAEKHALEMLKLGYFGHNSPVPENGSWDKRIRNEGYEGTPKSENCAMAGGARPERFATGSLLMWLWDPHHDPLIDPGVNQVGVGLVGPLASGSYGYAKRPHSIGRDPSPLPLAALEIHHDLFARVFGGRPAGNRAQAGR